MPPDKPHRYVLQTAAHADHVASPSSQADAERAWREAQGETPEALCIREIDGSGRTVRVYTPGKEEEPDAA